ncbi:MAG: bacteriohemerythrin [Sulfuricella sp.]|nr:bacteriohemerythrin [Sulfuricella sp.]
MALFEWNNSYRIGIAELDDQHHTLVQTINALAQALAHGEPLATLGCLFSDLVDYTRYHFKAEEALMTAAGGMPRHYRQHKAQHEDFIQTVANLGDTLDATNTQVAEATLDYLIHWLLHHIMGEDRAMARLLAGIPASVQERAVKDLGEPALGRQVAEKNLLAALRESERRFRTLADEVPVMIWMSEENQGRTFFNKTWQEFSARPIDEERGDGWRVGLHPEDIGTVGQSHEAASRSRDCYSVEYRLQHHDGTHRWLHESGVPRLLKNGEFAGHVGVCVDITESKAAEQVLRRSRDDLDTLVMARTVELRQANQQLSQEVEERRLAQAALLHTREEQRTLIGKLEQAHNQLLQSEKMASIGQLAAGVAHEINNPIGYVYSNIEALREYIEDAFAILAAYEEAEASMAEHSRAFAKVDALKDGLALKGLREDIFARTAESMEGLVRVKKIVQNLREFSHVDNAEWQLADLHRGLDSTLNIVNSELRYKAEVVKEYGNLPEVECLPFQLNQVFMNLLVNAGHAIEERGTIAVRTGTSGERIWVEIEDTGHGISAEHLNRIFDPFFTTKAVGKGTGLGLSLSYSIVQQHHGQIEVKSTPRTGSLFRVTLPVRQPPAGFGLNAGSPCPA